MNLRRLLAVSRKEVLQLRRDRRSMVLAFLLPLLLLLLFGYAISWDVREIATAVWDGDQTPASRALLDAFWASGYFDEVARVGDEAAARAALDRGEASVVLVLPRGFERDLASGETATVQALVDGSDANTATIVLAYARAIVLGYGARVRLEGGRPPLPLTVQSRVWYNEELRSRNMIVPGLVAVIMMIIAAMLTSLTLSREWERGTMEQLASTPVSRAEVVLGKLLPYLAIGMVDVAATSTVGVLLFDVPFRGSVMLLALLSFLFLLGASGIGIFVSAGSKSQLLATQVAMIVSYLPSLLLSGFMFAISSMPAPLRAVTYLIPARYFLVVTRGIFLKGVGIEVLRGEALLMALFAVAGVTLAVVRFKKELE
ncbi:MAG TPA: ABC transporter permease [Thermoanaerobaculia bacterium]|jgi:ABC-2 type transport system permease protein|nr:ABC transporter permease [Thermoanaerobaculia bacterium]